MDQMYLAALPCCEITRSGQTQQPELQLEYRAVAVCCLTSVELEDGGLRVSQATFLERVSFRSINR